MLRYGACQQRQSESPWRQGRRSVKQPGVRTSAAVSWIIDPPIDFVSPPVSFRSSTGIQCCLSAFRVTSLLSRHLPFLPRGQQLPRQAASKNNSRKVNRAGLPFLYNYHRFSCVTVYYHLGFTREQGAKHGFWPQRWHPSLSSPECAARSGHLAH